MTPNNTLQRSFTELKDFNMVFGIGFERSQVSDIIDGSFLERYPLLVTVKGLFKVKQVDNPNVPEEVMAQLKEAGRDFCINDNKLYKKIVEPTGEIFIDSFIDAQDSMIHAMNLPEIKATLSQFESKRSLITTSLYNSAGFKPLSTQYGEVTLSIADDSTADRNHRVCKVVMTLSKDGYYLTQEVGKFKYFVYGGRGRN